MDEWEINIENVIRDVNSIGLEDVTAVIENTSKVVTSSAVYAMKNVLIVHPSYVVPTAALSSTQTASGLEIGQTINIPLTVVFTQNDAGAASVTSLKKDGAQISTSNSYTDSSVVMSAMPKVYQATVTYAQGAVKNNNFSEADATGQISSGSVNSNSLSYRGYYKYFFGPVSATPANSAAVRALGSQLETSGTVIINTGTTLVNFALWIPNTHSITSVIDLDALSADITASYVQSTLSVNDAGGNAVTGKLYVMTNAVPYTNNHRHQITIS